MIAVVIGGIGDLLGLSEDEDDGAGEKNVSLTPASDQQVQAFIRQEIPDSNPEAACDSLGCNIEYQTGSILGFDAQGEIFEQQREVWRALFRLDVSIATIAAIGPVET